VLSEQLHTLTQLWRHAGASRERLAAFQGRKLRSVVQSAYDTVPFYRALYDRHRVDPRDIRGVEDLARLPLTSSQDYRTRAPAETLRRGVRAGTLVHRPTSGSTGRPFVIRRTRLEDHLLNQFRLRAFRSFGIRVRDRIGHVRLVSASHRRENLAGRARQALGVFREYPINSLQPAVRILETLDALRPDVIKGNPTILSHLAGHLESSPGRVPRPRILTTGGETLAPFRRQRIQEVFGRRIFDVYGSHEFNLLAWECLPHGGYHVCDDNVVLEVLRDGRPARAGERGEVVATALHCYAVPFIRYRLGDVVTRGPDTCPCGSPFSTLQGIRGRMHDYFRMPDGSWFHPDEIVVPVMEAEARWFDRYRLTQVREDRIVLEILPFAAPGPERLQKVERIARRQLPKGVSFRAEIVDRLELEAGGKFRYCRSLVGSDLDDVDWERF
jgi:phenylacetate-CoA ligase